MRLVSILLVCVCPFFCRAQVITTVVGNGIRGMSGDSAQATAAQLNQPIAVAVDDSGCIYVVDVGNDNIRKVSRDGIITTIAGKREDDERPRPYYYGATEDGVDSKDAWVWKAHGIVVDHRGNILFAESGNSTIRKISVDGIITTIAGRPNGRRANHDSDLASNAIIPYPICIAVDKDDNIFFTCKGHNTVHRISKSGFITTVAGNFRSGFSGDGGMATSASLNEPWGIAVDRHGSVYIADKNNNRIRKINNAGIISTIAGTGEKGYSGDGGPALKATFDEPRGIAVDSAGNVYVADSRNDAIRLVGNNGIITTVAGNGKRLYHGDDGFKSFIVYSRDKGKAGDGGPANAAQLHWPYDVALDRHGNLYIADDHHHVVRKVTFPVKKDTLKEKNAPSGLPPSTAGIDSMSVSGFLTVTAEDVNKLLNITFNNGAYNSYTITNNTDEVLMRGTLEKQDTHVDVKHLPEGHYLLNLLNGMKMKTVSFRLE